MEGWVNPAYRSSEGTTMRRGGRHKERICDDSELLTRTSWVDAKTAYKQIKKGKAFGNSCALWLRWHVQKHLFNLGSFIQRHCGKVLFVGLLLLSLCCIGLKTASIETNVEKLWVQAGGRLEKELKYSTDTLGIGSGTTNEIVIQTPKVGNNVLSVESFLLHVKALEAATKISVDMYNVKWKFKDICYTTNFPSFEESMFDMTIEKIIPCIIITPLDCFWEGSKLLGPEKPIYVPGLPTFTWKNLHPLELVQHLKTQFKLYFQLDSVEDIMRRAGISSGYLDKPCLDPNDDECPKTAPNKESRQPPNVGAEVTGGCEGFATKYMKWEEDLIIGGAKKNRSGYITRAESIQSIIQLSGEKELYDYYKDADKVFEIDWTMEKAKEILKAWQRKFTNELEKIHNNEDQKKDNIYPFSSTSLLDILSEFSEISSVRVIIGYLLMLFYACISLLKWSDAVKSQSGIAIFGVLLVALSVAAGLGICSVIGIKFNAATTQIVPFLALGLGVDDMFLIAHTFAEHANRDDIVYTEQTGEVLKRTGVSVLLTSLSNITAFFMAAIIPIPALRAFTLQVAILIIFNLGSILLVYPAIVSLDLIRREEKRMDVFCCFIGSSANRVIELKPQRGDPPPPEYREQSPPPPYSSNDQGVSVHQAVAQVDPSGSRPVTVLAPVDPDYRNSIYSQASTTSSRQCLAQEETLTCKERCVQTQRECCAFSLTWFAKKMYGPALEKTSAKIFVIILFVALLVFGIIGTTKVQDGLDLTDVVPRQTNEYNFLEAQSKYFGFYNMYAVTQDKFDYPAPSSQKMLLDYHKAFHSIRKIIREDDGSLPKFWLQLFRVWLQDIQKAFDKDLHSGCIVKETWFNNATDEGILGYKLMVQTGDRDEPIDKERIYFGRLVEDDGFINPDAFYIYLTAWVSCDSLAYAASQANFHPYPTTDWVHDPADRNLKIPKSQALIYAQIPFFLHELGNTQEVATTIEEIREICYTFSENGLPNYPSGIPFTFWEQYINLRFYLMLSLICVLGGIFMVLTIVLMNPWAAMVVVVVLAMMVVELFGFMGLFGIKLSAVPAVILIVSVGIGVEFTVHVCLGFITAIGSRNQRMVMALEHMFAPVVHGAVSTLLGVIMLAGAEFDFIVKYFFIVLSVLVLLGMLNGLILLPVLLSLLGPSGEVIPINNADRLEPPTPEPSPPPQPRHVRSVSRRVFPRVPSDISLTTITEEPTQYSSHEIVVQPEVVVETSLSNNHTAASQTNNSHTSPPSSSHSTPPPIPTRHITTVRATTKVKVEVHAPMPTLPGQVEHFHSGKSKRRKPRSGDTSDWSNSNTDSDSAKSSYA